MRMCDMRIETYKTRGKFHLASAIVRLPIQALRHTFTRSVKGSGSIAMSATRNTSGLGLEDHAMCQPVPNISCQKKRNDHHIIP